MKHTSAIQAVQLEHIKHLAAEYQKDKSEGHFRCSDFKPGDDGFYRFESGKTLLRKWQKNPEDGGECYTLDQFLRPVKVIADPKFRLFFQAYRCCDIYLTLEDCMKAGEERFEENEKRMYRYYGETKQLDLFQDSMKLVSAG